MKYKINEIFESMQGEGANQGKVVIFIRLSGCNLKCAWCDTTHESNIEYSVEEILTAISCYKSKSVIITGGEPTIHNLIPLLAALKENGYWIGMETNGTNKTDALKLYIDYIAMSPKGNFTNFICDEVRFVNDSLTPDILLAKAKDISASSYFISPLDKDGYINIKETMSLVGILNEISDKKWRISLQLHKFAGIQ